MGAIQEIEREAGDACSGSAAVVGRQLRSSEWRGRRAWSKEWNCIENMSEPGSVIFKNDVLSVNRFPSQLKVDDTPGMGMFGVRGDHRWSVERGS